MAKHTRTAHPKRVAWHQDNVLHERLYWLAVDAQDASKGTRIAASYDGQTITVETAEVSSLKIRLNDRMMNLDQPVTVQYRGETVYEGTPKRTVGTIAQTLEERGDYRTMYTAEIDVKLKR
jgi:hypothetical protein